jgi:DNA-3-methyladenine glycosylase II
VPVPTLVPRALTDADLPAAVEQLAARDPALAGIADRFGTPPLWAREPGFPTLVHLILEQQVSLASARAAFDRLNARTGRLTPQTFLALDDPELLAVGFSRQKTRYARVLARAIDGGELDLDALAGADDDEVDRRLTALPGIGPWTATIYRLMVLCRPDAWPAHDIALAQAFAEVRGLASRPSPGELTAAAEAWRPLRAVAARLLWHHYLSVRAERRAATSRATADPVVVRRAPQRAQRGTK